MEYKLGIANRGAYSLSRRKEQPAELTALSHLRWLDFDELIVVVHNDPKLQSIIIALQRDSSSHP